MKMFYLRLKSGDIVGRVNANSREIAINYFSQIKRLVEKDLLEIFEITE